MPEPGTGLPSPPTEVGRVLRPPGPCDRGAHSPGAKPRIAGLPHPHGGRLAVVGPLLVGPGQTSYKPGRAMGRWPAETGPASGRKLGGGHRAHPFPAWPRAFGKVLVRRGKGAGRAPLRRGGPHRSPPFVHLQLMCALRRDRSRLVPPDGKSQWGTTYLSLLDPPAGTGTGRVPGTRPFPRRRGVLGTLIRSSTGTGFPPDGPRGDPESETAGKDLFKINPRFK